MKIPAGGAQLIAKILSQPCDLCFFQSPLSLSASSLLPVGNQVHRQEPQLSERSCFAQVNGETLSRAGLFGSDFGVSGWILRRPKAMIQGIWATKQSGRTTSQGSAVFRMQRWRMRPIRWRGRPRPRSLGGSRASKNGSLTAQRQHSAAARGCHAAGAQRTTRSTLVSAGASRPQRAGTPVPARRSRDRSGPLCTAG